MALTSQQIESIVAAILAVNSYPLNQAYALVPRLREKGLTDPSTAARMDLASTIEALTTAGYDRGHLTWMLAERLKAFMTANLDGTLDGLDRAIAARDKVAATERLLRVRGVGPRVFENAWMLLTTGDVGR